MAVDNAKLTEFCKDWGVAIHDHNYMVEEFKNQNYFGSTLQEDTEQEQVIDDARKKVNKTLDMKQIKILKLQLDDPNLSDKKRQNRQKELDSLTTLYGDK